MTPNYIETKKKKGVKITDGMIDSKAIFLQLICTSCRIKLALFFKKISFMFIVTLCAIIIRLQTIQIILQYLAIDFSYLFI